MSRELILQVSKLCDIFKMQKSKFHSSEPKYMSIRSFKLSQFILAF